MGKIVAFIGHSLWVHSDTPKTLDECIEKCIEEGYDRFVVGRHGAFDQCAFAACKRAKERHPHINIDLVHTSTSIMRPDGISNDPSLGFSTLIYDIETVHFKRRITYSNRRMIDECDLLICFVEEIITTGGAAAAYRYAKKKNKKIINIF